jgi:hypothetical protein
MKIAILTQPLRTNYGGILQAYALQTVLQRRGHEVIVINRAYQDYPSIKLLYRRVGSILKSLIRRYIQGKKEYIIMNPFSSLFRTKWDGYIIQPFVKNKICQSPELRNSESMKRYFAKQKFDCYIVGSDQVWRPCYSPCITDFFLKSVPDASHTKKVAYAASFGTDQWEMAPSETEECARLAQIFDAISVREESGVRLCKQYLGVDAVHLLDPTMLLKVEDYICLFKEKGLPKSSGNLFCYVLDNNQEVDKIINLLEIEGFTPQYAHLDTTPTKENQRPVQLSIEEWLRGIYDADFVVTDSFHACVFSVIFHKPFVVYGNIDRGMSRIQSLLKMFDLNGRLVRSVDEFIGNKDCLVRSDDAAMLNDTINSLREECFAFMEDAGL